MFEEIGNDFCLIALDGDDDVIDDIQSSANRLQIPLKVICDNQNGQRDSYATRYILVRPDHYIVWKGDTAPQNIEKLLSKVAGR